MKKIKKILFLLLLYGAVGPRGLLAQVSLAPTTLFTDANGIATLYVTNPGDGAQEVTVSFVFGYPAYTEEGLLEMRYEDGEKEGLYGLGERLRSFPRSFVLAPLQQQLVRVQVRPDRNKPDGMYYMRVKVSSSGQTADVGTAAGEGIATQVNFRFDQVIAIFHKQGNVSTSLNLGDTRYEREDRRLHVISDYARGGNAPFIGSVIAQLKDPQNQVVAEQRQTVALYFDARHRVSLELPEDLVRGDYELTLDYRTQRSDISSTDLVQAEPVRKVMRIRID